jgi:ankyrin repeat protein
VPVETPNKAGNTPLALAMKNGHELVALTLMDAVSPQTLKAADIIGNTTLHYAAIRGSNVCAVTLLRNGVSPDQLNKDKRTPLMLAIMNGHETVALTLLQAMSKEMICASDNHGNTSLHFAAKTGLNICAINLLRSGIQVDQMNTVGETALSLAVSKGYFAVALTLIQQQANIFHQVHQ